MKNSRLERLLKDKASEQDRHRQQLDYLNREIEREKENLKVARQQKKDLISPEQQAWKNSFTEEDSNNAKKIKVVTAQLLQVLNSLEPARDFI